MDEKKKSEEKKFDAQDIDDVFATLKNTQVSAGQLDQLDASLENLLGTLEDLKESASLEDCESLDALGDMFGGFNAKQHAKYDSDRAASEALQKESLDKCRDIVLDALAYSRAWMTGEYDQMESHRVKAGTRLDELIGNFGMDAIDDQLRRRFAAVVAATDSPDLSSITSTNIECSDEMEQAIKNLFGWDDLMEKYGKGDSSKFND